MIYPTITDRDERNYLNILKNSDLVGYPNSADQSYYARILRYKYPQCQQVKLTAITFQVLQSGISAVPVRLTAQQSARQQLLDALDVPLEATITKNAWLRALRANHLFPYRTLPILQSL